MLLQKVLTTGALISALTFSFSSATVGAAGHQQTGVGPNPFSECGIGAALFPTVSWAAVTSNVIWDLGLTGLTSATASPETCNSKQVETAQFIIDNYENIAEETARGEGQHLTAMLTLRGCAASSHPALTQSVRQNMAAEVVQGNYSAKSLVEKSSSYYDALDSSISKSPESCTI